MKRAMLIAAAVALLSASAAAAATSRTTALTSACPYGPIVVNVSQVVSNDFARNTAGRPFALQSYTRQLVVFKVGPQSYCALTNARGTFSTVGGASPGGGGTVAAGVTGIFSAGTGTTIFNARWRPLAPTSGSIGSFDYGCSDAWSCPSLFDWTSLWFADVYGLKLQLLSEWYLTSANGTWWARSDVGSGGDITG
jgi:hypothetical protein